jgi:ADP-glucose pyrophosphorylase
LGARFDGRGVIEADAIVEAGTFLRRSMILEGAHVSTGTVLEDVVVDRGVHVRGGHYRRGCLVADQTHSGAIEFVPFATSGS